MFNVMGIKLSLTAPRCEFRMEIGEKGALAVILDGMQWGLGDTGVGGRSAGGPDGARAVIVWALWSIEE